VAEEIPVDKTVVEAEAGEKLKTGRVNHKHGRRKLPEHLPRIEIPHDLSEKQKPCPCCGEMRVCIGSEISEQLEIVIESLKVLKPAARDVPIAMGRRTSRLPPRRPVRSRRGFPGRGWWLT
jgi:transposase